MKNEKFDMENQYFESLENTKLNFDITLLRRKFRHLMTVVDMLVNQVKSMELN